jgi:formylglycine-generating enzyme required for sulfatase activity
MQKILRLIITGMIIIPPAFGDEYTQFECDATPEVCLSRVIAKLQKQISALETKLHALESKQTDDFKVSGSPDKFYPIVFRAEAWHEGLFSIEIFHDSEKGKLISQFKCHSSPQAPSLLEIHQQSQKWIADAWCHQDEKNLVVYLRGGDMNYAWRANQSTVLLDEMPSNQLAWLDSKPKALLPARGSTTALFNKDDIYAFMPDLKILALDNFSVGGEPDKFYHKVFRAEHEGLLSIEIFHASEKDHLISQFNCESSSESSVEIHQDSQRWIADAWCNEKSLIVFLRGGERNYFWRSNQSGVLLEESTMPALETTVALFDKNDVQASLSLIKILEGGAFQDRLKNGGFGPQMVWIPAGRFRMGDIQGGGSSDEKPVHEVSVDRFAMGKHEVTVGQFRQFVNATGYKTEAEKGDGCYSYKNGLRKLKEANWHNSYLSQNDNHPVVCVSWNDANAYAEWLSQQTGQKYRLPTEAQWEYAARAGTETRYWWGNSIGSNKVNCPNSECGDRFKYMAPVNSFAPNPFGLYDMLGNVWEWTCSEYSSSYNGNEKSCNEFAKRLSLRGGSWYIVAWGMRSADRNDGEPSERSAYLGLRVARD